MSAAYQVYLHQLKNQVQKSVLEGIDMEGSFKKDLLNLLEAHPTETLIIFNEAYSKGVEDGIMIGRTKKSQPLNARDMVHISGRG